mgnify:CR=1 FL=1
MANCEATADNVISSYISPAPALYLSTLMLYMIVALILVILSYLFQMIHLDLKIRRYLQLYVYVETNTLDFSVPLHAHLIVIN